MIEEIHGPLASICSAVDGAIAASVMGFDGLPVQDYEHAVGDDDPDISSLLVEFSTLLGQVKASGQMFAAGDLQELSIRSESVTTLIRPINAEYFMALALRPAANAGKGRYLLRVHAPKLADFLS